MSVWYRDMSILLVCMYLYSISTFPFGYMQVYVEARGCSQCLSQVASLPYFVG